MHSFITDTRIKQLNQRWDAIKTEKHLMLQAGISNDERVGDIKDITAMMTENDENQLVDDLSQTLQDIGMPSPWGNVQDKASRASEENNNGMLLRGNQRLIPLCLILLESLYHNQSFVIDGDRYGSTSPMTRLLVEDSLQAATTTREINARKQRLHDLSEELASRMIDSLYNSPEDMEQLDMEQLKSEIAKKLDLSLDKGRPTATDEATIDTFVTNKVDDLVNWMKREELSTTTDDLHAKFTAIDRDMLVDRIKAYFLEKSSEHYFDDLYHLTFCDPEQMSEDKQTALQNMVRQYPGALRSANTDVIRFLIERGTIQDIINTHHDGQNLLQLGVLRQSYGLLKVALENINNQTEDINAWRSLCLDAVSGGDHRIFRQLLRMQNSQGTPYLTSDPTSLGSGFIFSDESLPVWTSSESAIPLDEMIKIINQEGGTMDINAYHRGASALQYSQLEGLSNMTQQLIKAGVELDQEEDGLTPLIISITQNDMEVLSQLIAAGADVNKEMKNGITPLILAICMPNEAALDQLIAARVDVSAMNKNGHNALAYAAVNGNSAMVEKLLSAGADTTMYYGSAHFHAMDHGDDDMLFQLLSPKTGAKQTDSPSLEVFLAAVTWATMHTVLSPVELRASRINDFARSGASIISVIGCIAAAAMMYYSISTVDLSSENDITAKAISFLSALTIASTAIDSIFKPPRTSP